MRHGPRSRSALSTSAGCWGSASPVISVPYTASSSAMRAILERLRGVLAVLRALDVHPQPGERLADETRDLHLAHADALGDLGLGQILREAQAQDLLVAVGKDVEGALEQDAHFGAAHLGVEAADRVGQRHVLADRLLQRARAPGVLALDRLQDLLERRVDRFGELLDVGRTAELVRELVACAGDLQLELLHAAGHAHRPGLVTEVALDLTQDGGRRVGREAHLAIEIEAVDRLHDPDAGDLHEVVDRLAAAGVAPGEGAGQWQHLLGELVAGGLIALLMESAQELTLATGARGVAHRAPT